MDFFMGWHKGMIPCNVFDPFYMLCHQKIKNPPAFSLSASCP